MVKQTKLGKLGKNIKLPIDRSRPLLCMFENCSGVSSRPFPDTRPNLLMVPIFFYLKNT